MVKVKEQMHVSTNEETKRWPQNNFIVMHLGLKGLFLCFIERMKWSPRTTKALRERFAHWIHLPSPQKNLPGKESVHSPNGKKFSADFDQNCSKNTHVLA
jgi:hypothetical protein